MQISLSKKPRISVLILVHHRLELLKLCLESLENHVFSEDWELLLILNDASLEVENWLRAYSVETKLPIRMHVVQPSRPGAARILGANYASGDVILFLDDDIELFQDIVSECKILFSDPSIAAAGGANLTPKTSVPLARASGYAMASYLGAASMSQRYFVQNAQYFANEHSLILCNLAVRKDNFKKYSFPRHFVSNEENILLQQLENSGAKLICSPLLAVYHHRRSTVRGLAEQNFKYGMGRAQNILAYPLSISALYFLPMFFLFSHFFLNKFPLLFFIYGILIFTQTMVELFRSRDTKAIILLPLVFYITHIFYGIGFFVGLISWAWRKRVLCETA